MKTTTVLPSVNVVIPYLDREDHLTKSTNAWLAQTYKGQLGIVVVDFSDTTSFLDLTRVRVVRSQDTRWNICRARNLGARSCHGRLLVFAPADVLPEPYFVSELVAQYDQYDMWVTEGLLRRVPYDPSLNGFFAIKRWVNTKIRGFHEPLMENPHGWGYDTMDYILRAKDCIASSGGSVSEFPIEAATVLPNTDEDRAAPYECKDLAKSYSEHEQYSADYRATHGYVANVGSEWGQAW